LETIIQKADLLLLGSERETFFQMFYSKLALLLFFLSCETSHRFCFNEIKNFLFTMVTLFSLNRLNVVLFENSSTIDGMISFLTSSIVEKFPLVSVQELKVCSF
jgi:hypothetical protein